MNILIGKKIKEMRTNKNWSQEEAADYLNVSKSAFQG